MRTILVALSLVALGFFSATAEAEPGTGGDAKAEAKAIAVVGYQLYGEGRYDEAIVELEKAEHLYHAPTLVFAIGQAHAKQGRLLEARALFQKVAGETLPPGAPKPFKQAQDRAKEELVSLAPRIPTMTIRFTGAAERKSTVTVGGADLPPAKIGQPLERNPGSYTVVVALLGGTELSRVVDLKEGVQEQVTIDVPAPIEVKPAVVKPPPPPVSKIEPKAPSKPETKPAPKPIAREEAPQRKGSLAPALVSFGVGAAGLGVGIWAGVATLTNAGLIKPYCKGTACDPYVTDMLQRTKTLSLVSTVAFAVAGVGAATGVTLLVVRSKGKAPLQAEVRAGPAIVELKGVF